MLEVVKWCMISLSLRGGLKMPSDAVLTFGLKILKFEEEFK